MLHTSPRTKRDGGNENNATSSSPTTVEESRLSLALVFLLVLDDMLAVVIVNSFLMTAAACFIFSRFPLVVMAGVCFICVQLQFLRFRDSFSAIVGLAAGVAAGVDAGAATEDTSVLPGSGGPLGGAVVTSSGPYEPRGEDALVQGSVLVAVVTSVTGSVVVSGI